MLLKASAPPPVVADLMGTFRGRLLTPRPAPPLGPCPGFRVGILPAVDGRGHQGGHDQTTLAQRRPAKQQTVAEVVGGQEFHTPKQKQHCDLS